MLLTAIISIDRDVDLSEKLYQALLENDVTDILIVTRVSDIKTIEFWKSRSKVITVPHYEISGRHNMEKMSEKRMIIMNYVKKYGYNYLWFVDSDIIPTQGVLAELINTDKDICVAPYRIKWLGFTAVGVSSKESPFIQVHQITESDKIIPRRPCIYAGFGCTLLKNTTFNITVENIRIEGKNIYCEGDDLGFFLNCFKQGLTCEYLTRYDQPHYYDR